MTDGAGPSALDLVSTITGFVAGVVTGATGSYLGNRLTDRRREQKESATAKRDFKSVRDQMPELIAEMKTDLAVESQRFVREFFVLPNRKVCLGGSEKPRLIYYVEDHGDLHGKLSILENHGYIIDVTPKNTPIYRMTEEFVALVREHG